PAGRSLRESARVSKRDVRGPSVTLWLPLGPRVYLCERERLTTEGSSAESPRTPGETRVARRSLSAPSLLTPVGRSFVAGHSAPRTEHSSKTRARLSARDSISRQRPITAISGEFGVNRPRDVTAA